MPVAKSASDSSFLIFLLRWFTTAKMTAACRTACRTASHFAVRGRFHREGEGAWQSLCSPCRRRGPKEPWQDAPDPPDRSSRRRDWGCVVRQQSLSPPFMRLHVVEESDQDVQQWNLGRLRDTRNHVLFA